MLPHALHRSGANGGVRVGEGEAVLGRGEASAERGDLQPVLRGQSPDLCRIHIRGTAQVQFHTLAAERGGLAERFRDIALKQERRLARAARRRGNGHLHLPHSRVRYRNIANGAHPRDVLLRANIPPRRWYREA